MKFPTAPCKYCQEIDFFAIVIGRDDEEIPTYSRKCKACERTDLISKIHPSE